MKARVDPQRTDLVGETPLMEAFRGREDGQLEGIQKKVVRVGAVLYLFYFGLCVCVFVGLWVCVFVCLFVCLFVRVHQETLRNV